MTPVRLLFLLLASWGLASAALAGDSGVQGRAAWRGELVPGVTVRAYRSLEALAAGKTVASSAPTALDGTYRLELPPGEYYLTARDDDGTPRPGSHFCYYSGSPVRVSAGRFTQVGFNLVKVPAEAPPSAGEVTGIRGVISYLDQPLEQAYLYVYRDPQQGFKGPGYLIHPVARGEFRLRLPPGDYWLLARKRAAGGQFGPIEIGDYFNFYHGNPVRVRAGEMREVRIEAITRLEMLEGSGERAVFQGVRGRILGADGAPAAGVRVFAYREAAMTGLPAFFSPPSGSDGRFELTVGEPGVYHLLAREHFGGPAAEGERYGRLAGGSAGVRVERDQTVAEVTIHVAPR